MSLPALSQANRQERAQSRLGSMVCDRWRLDSLLGVGGMAAVYAATHRNGSRVAIKMLHPELVDYEDLRERFLEEGYLSNRVGGRGVVAMLDEGVADDGALLLVMELLDGCTLEQLCRDAVELPLCDVLRLGDEVLGILTRAHEHGVVHRDIKPDNVFVTRAGEIKLLDFGIAHVTESRRSHPTELGSAMGTPAFMPPEQARGRWDLFDARSDLWALAATLYFSLSGHYVHEGTTVNEELLLAMTVRAKSLSVHAPMLPTSLVAFIDRALSFEPEQRFSDAQAMRVALRKVFAELSEQELGAPILPSPRGESEGSTLTQSGMQSVRPLSASYRPPRQRRRPGALAILSLAALTLCGLGGWSLLTSEKPAAAAIPAPTPRAPASAAPELEAQPAPGSDDVIPPPPSAEPETTKAAVQPSSSPRAPARNAAPRFVKPVKRAPEPVDVVELDEPEVPRLPAPVPTPPPVFESAPPVASMPPVVPPPPPPRIVKPAPSAPRDPLSRRK